MCLYTLRQRPAYNRSDADDCRYFQLFLGYVMANLAKEAVVGLEKKLKAMEREGKLDGAKAPPAVPARV